MVKSLNKHGISFEMVNPSLDIQRELPIWHHPGEDSQRRQENNGQKAKCLREKHATLTVGNGMKMAQRLEDPLHENNALCECESCEDDRKARGCKDPNACVKAAASRLKQILPKWVPAARSAEEQACEARPVD
ncbi:hypothetical protein B0H10DRAFT_1778225 [Mycena sp. CBHHK59/15]|nr:hypothetical protein B0H10DRAFT_1778225 [Mycena sp. CBHHK59/15]